MCQANKQMEKSLFGRAVFLFEDGSVHEAQRRTGAVNCSGLIHAEWILKELIISVLCLCRISVDASDTSSFTSCGIQPSTLVSVWGLQVNKTFTVILLMFPPVQNCNNNPLTLFYDFFFFFFYFSLQTK